MTTKITTDWHVSAKRIAGTTPQSRLALTEAIYTALESALDPNYDHIIAGDLYDGFDVETKDILRTFKVLANFLLSGDKTLVMLRGNHDHTVKDNKVSGFELTAQLLEAQFGSRVVVVREVTQWKEFTLIPHLVNNDLLELEVEKLTNLQNRVFIFHANFDNPFCSGDHSLNVTREMADTLLHSGNVILFGHEHAYREIGDVTCLGNSYPSSIADALGGPKFAWYVGDDIRNECIWHPEGVFAKLEWHALDDVDQNLKFIRVGGAATVAEAPAALAAIAKLRQSHDAFVITNAVEIEGMSNDMEVASLESVKSFNVLEALMEVLSPEEGEVVKELLEC